MELLFETTTSYTYNEMRRYESFILLRSYYPRLIALMLVFVAVGAVVMISGAEMVGTVLIIGTVAGIGLRMTVTAVNSPKRIMKHPLFDKTVTVRFFEEHFTMEHDNDHSETDYRQIHRIYETERSFYIIIEAIGGLIVTKKNCSEELAEFIRELSNNKKHKRK